MSWLRNQFQDLRYLISKDNQTSRGFYLTLVIISVLLLVVFTALFVCACLNIPMPLGRIFGFAGLPVLIVLLVGIMALLSRN